MLKLQLPDIKRLEALARSNEKVISFSQGGLRLEVPAVIKDSVRSMLSSSVIDYYGLPAGIIELRDALAQRLSNTYNTSLTRENIIVTHGCSGALSNLCLTLLEAGDEVILPEPTYPGYENIVRIAKALPHFVPAHDGDIDVELIKNATTAKTKMMIIANPSNPTGKLLEEKKLLELIAWCEEKKIYLILDEVYEDYVFEGQFYSITPYINRSPYLIKVSSFSKNAAMSGWRIGYIVLSTEIFEHVLSVKDAIFISPSVIGQYGALAALKNPQIFTEFNRYVKRNRDYAFEALKPLIEKNILSCEKPASAFYLFIKTHDTNTADRCMDMLSAAHIALVPGKTFGTSCSSYIRLCYARKFDVLEEGMKRFVNYWNMINV